MANDVEEIKKRTQQIEFIYQKYLVGLTKFQKKQNEIIARFVKELEKRKIEELEKKIKQ